MKAPEKSTSKGAVRAYHHGDLAAALIDEGVRAIEESGLEALSLRAVARQTEVSAAAVYRHFADKDALLAAIAGRGFTEINRAFEAALEGAKRRNALGRLRALGQTYIAFALTHPGLYRLMFGAARPGFGRHDALESEAAKAWQILGETVAAAFPAQSTARAIKAATVAAWSLVHGYAVLRLEGQLPPEDMPDADSVLANLVPREPD
ncbi:MAG TPA: TetR/AcrR family transcriptional regulator [Magnetospirillaceae bacterium]|jgi:AcrR family transcriptional regulator